MLELINRYCHGYVSIPVILACREKGLFRHLAEEIMTVEDLAVKFKANLGHLQVAFRLLQSMGGLTVNKDGECALTRKITDYEKVPLSVLSLLQFPWDEYFQQGKNSLMPWLELSQQRWHVNDLILADFLDGLLAIPLLLALLKLIE